MPVPEHDNKDIVNRLDEHGNTLDRHGIRLNQHEARIDGLSLVILGDQEKRYIGILDRIGALEEIVTEIKQWRRDLRVAISVGLGLLGFVGAGVWWPILRSILGGI